MEKQQVNNQILLIGVAIISALLVIVGHLILTKSFVQFAWVEYTAAAIPFVMFGLCLLGVKLATRAQDRVDPKQK
ncbi:hypothetical protein [Vibrio rhodolitus]|uniref:hypothetical protein n=1 Tax=Vibrio rhodolitus TaxID=2231649 RepID=UPI000E0A377F|nr:hypothetical protein [Vibrio rhodolitus]